MKGPALVNDMQPPTQIQLSSKVAKFAGWIEIDLALIFCKNNFFCAILIFWDMINFVFFFVREQKSEEFFFLVDGFASRTPHRGLRPQAPNALGLTH